MVLDYADNRGRGSREQKCYAASLITVNTEKVRHSALFKKHVKGNQVSTCLVRNCPV